MSFLDIDFSGTEEPKIADANEEYTIRIVGITQKDNKSGNPYMMPIFDIPDEPLVKNFSKYFPLPYEGMDTKDLNKCKWALLKFCEAFDIDTSGPVDPDSVIGHTAWAVLGVSEDEEYGEQNFIRRFIGSK